MIDGIKMYDEDPNFEIDMLTYGDWGYEENPKSGEDAVPETNMKKKICYGCAATCAIQKITGITFNPDNISYSDKRCVATELDFIEMDDFEMVINRLRTGDCWPLLHFYDLQLQEMKLLICNINSLNLPSLDNRNYKSRYTDYEKLYDLLIENKL